jgi:hypothetical protein
MNACNNTDNPLLSEGGMGGTGIVMGRISALDSIVVNGVKYNTGNAVYTRDGVTVNNQNDFAVGEVVTVKGNINSDGKTGNANAVIFSDILEGPVTAKPVGIASNLQIMGQNVYTNDLTILHGFKFLTELNLDDIVEVSGFRDVRGGIQASSITLKKVGVSVFEIKGTISNLDQAKQIFRLGNLTVDFANAELPVSRPLAEGQSVEVYAQKLLNLVLTASKIQPLQVIELTPETELEVEGVITRFASITDFDLNNISVLTTANTMFKDGIFSELKLNSLVEIEGVVNNNGDLVAEEISLIESENLAALEANIDSIDAANNTLTILDNVIHVNSATILFDESNKRSSTFKLEELAVGEYVDVKVRVQNDGRLIALRLSREDQEESIGFKGKVGSINKAAGSFVLFNLEQISDANTIYLGSDEKAIDKATFFAALKQNVSFVEAEGQLVGSKTILMERVIIKLTQ